MKSEKRDFKFYRENEAEAMRKLGLEPTPNSGSGWKVKEDGQNEFLICQHKCTDKSSISIKQKDIRMLEKNAAVEKKKAIFAIQFNNTGEMWIMAKPEDFIYVADSIRESVSPAVNGSMDTLLSAVNADNSEPKHKRPIVKSAPTARDRLMKEREEAQKLIDEQWKQRRREMRNGKR